MKKLILLVPLILCQMSSLALSAVETYPTLVTDLSKKVISINVNFSGSKFHIFGAVKRNVTRTTPIDQPPFDILIEVIGPSVSLDLFKKERIYGFWVNQRIHSFKTFPSFYSISGTKPLEKAVSNLQKRKNNIGFLEQVTANEDLSLDSEILNSIKLTEKYKSAFKKESKPIVFRENTLFSTEIDLPTDLVEGNYLVRIHLVRFEEVIVTQEDIIFVKKVGHEQWIHHLAHKKPEIYGLIAIFLAVAFGWLASILFRTKAY